MADPVALARVTEDPIDPDAVAALVADDRFGALVVFHGVVRDHDGGRGVGALGYEAHPSAETELEAVARDAAGSDSRVAVVHRIGELVVGDLALVCAVAAPHRAAAFATCERIVDELKHRVPIWKHQRFVDGTAEWVGIGDEPPRSLER